MSYTGIPEIVYSEILGGGRTAMVFRLGNLLFGGVFVINGMTVNINTDINVVHDYSTIWPRYSPGRKHVDSEIAVEWEVFGSVSDADRYIRDRGWEDRVQIENTRMLEHKS